MDNSVALTPVNAALATVDNTSGEIVETPIPSYEGIARAAFTEKQQAILKRPIDPALVKKRPDGHYYVDGIHYRNVLDEAFGVGAWAILPIREWTEPTTMHTRNGDKQVAKVYLQGQLWIEGRFISQSIGEDVYYLDNQADSYATAWEKANSNLLMRCCKALGIFRDLWNKDWLKQNERSFGKGLPPNGQAPQSNAPTPELRKRNDTPSANAQPTGQVNGQAVPRHRTESGAGAFQRGPVMPVTTDRIDQLCRHFGIRVEKVPKSFEKDGQQRTYNEYHVTGTSEPLKVCIPSHILSACSRSKDEPRDRKKGLWIQQNTIAFLFDGLTQLFTKLDEHAKMITDRKPGPEPTPLERQAPPPSYEPEMLAQYQDEELPF